MKTTRALEKRSFSEVIGRLADARRYALTLTTRIEAIPRPNHGHRVLDLGAAAGCLTVALNEMGYPSVGVEPDPDALENAWQLARRLHRPRQVVDGYAEEIPFPSESFDIVIANSVLECVSDIDACLREVSRVLSPGGVFWFAAASSMSPFQNEIAKFPLFGWYPDSLKIRIMCWAVRNRPDLIGHTLTPAVNWFSDRWVHRELAAVGFTKIYDRWDLRGQCEGGRIERGALRLLKNSQVLRQIARACVPGCAYAAVKRYERNWS